MASGEEKQPLLGARPTTPPSHRGAQGSAVENPIINGIRSSPINNNNNNNPILSDGLTTKESTVSDKFAAPDIQSCPDIDIREDIDIISYGSTVKSTITSSSEPQTAVYGVRWYLLFLLSMNGFVQGLIWNTFGPISTTCKGAFNWGNGDIALLANWGCISFFLALFPFNYIIERCGLRAALLCALFPTFVGTSVRLVPVMPWNKVYTMHLGQFLSGLGGPVSMAVPPIFSATWFPPQQRTSATAIGALLNLLGIALSFFVGPAFVSEIPQMKNITVDYHNLPNLHNTSITNITSNATSLIPYLRDIENLMWFEWALITILLVMALIHFPNKPPRPPSLSASTPKGNLGAGLLAITKVPNFWLLALPYGLCAGCFSTYGTQLNNIWGQFNVTQEDAGHLGFYYSVSGIGASFIMAFAADKFAGHFKTFLLVLTLIMTGCFTWICLMYWRVFPMVDWYLYLAFILFAVCQTSTIPLFYEATIEAVYPISDSIASCMLTLVNNVSGALYLLVFGLDGIGVDWSNWAMLGMTAFGIPLLIAFRPSYNRLIMDQSNREIGESSDSSTNSAVA